MKCFLSHSSKDKANYVDIVAQKLGGRIEYDAKTFEEGMENLEEILNAIGRSNIFVLFISESSLNSPWVQKEILEAELRLKNGQLIRFYPIVIDKSIKHDDPRIPTWISQTYNLRPITRPVIAAKRIKERLTEASWEVHPSLKIRNQIFVGRNTIIEAFERRVDDLSKEYPSVVFASGLQNIGRRSSLKNCLRKSNIIRQTYEPIDIELSSEDNIEGLILKLIDLGFSSSITHNLLELNLDEKITICHELINEALNLNEILFIDDQRCIVRYDQTIAPWFLKIIEKLPKGNLGICVASAAKPFTYDYVKNDNIYFIHVHELEKSEREGLFKRYSEVLGLNLSREELRQFSPLLTGLPDQVTFAASMVEEIGPQQALERANEIVLFSKYRAGIYLKKYENNEEALAALRFLSSFEFFSIDFITEIENLSNTLLTKHVQDFITNLVCESIGYGSDYYRINEVIRDSITRDRLYVNKEYTSALKLYVRNFTDNFESEHYDVSEYYIAAKEALINGEKIPEKLLIPAHFLKTMKELYSKGRHDDVVRLADRVLEKEENYDIYTAQDIRYYLCQSLARLRNVRFTTEVQKISGPEHDFLFGFYYRIRGKFEDALKRYTRAKEHQRVEQRAAREIVFVLTTIEAYEEAISLAQENYERYPSNPFMVQAYFQCLMHTDDHASNATKAQQLLDSMHSIGGARAAEMYATLSARLEFQFHDRKHSFEMIEQAIDAYPDVAYPVLAKLDMAIHVNDAQKIEQALLQLKKASTPTAHSLAKRKGEIVLEALHGRKGRALQRIQIEMSELNQTAKDRLIRKINLI